MILAYDGQTAF